MAQFGGQACEDGARTLAQICQEGQWWSRGERVRVGSQGSQPRPEALHTCLAICCCVRTNLRLNDVPPQHCTVFCDRVCWPVGPLLDFWARTHSEKGQLG